MGINVAHLGSRGVCVEKIVIIQVVVRGSRRDVFTLLPGVILMTWSLPSLFIGSLLLKSFPTALECFKYSAVVCVLIISVSHYAYIRRTGKIETMLIFLRVLSTLDVHPSREIYYESMSFRFLLFMAPIDVKYVTSDW